MPDQRLPLSAYLPQAGLVLIGGGLGWLIGLSVSPVVTSVAGTAGAIVATMTGLEKVDGAEATSTRSWQINPLPFALLILGLIIGSSVGLTARQQSLFGSDVSLEIDKWSATGLSEQEIARRIFETQYPDYAAQPESETPNLSPPRPIPDQPGGLFSMSSDECKRFSQAYARSDEALLEALSESDDPTLQALPQVISDSATLYTLLENVLCLDAE